MGRDTTNGGRLSRMVEPLRRFLDLEAAGSILLLAGTTLALILANSPWQDFYFDLLHSVITVDIGGFRISEDLVHWINDGLMTIFFLVVGLEIKRELVDGELNSRSKAMLPVAAAVGGMVVPALIYAAFNTGGEGSAGWGIPMATDIAFAVAILALVAPNASNSLKVFLLSLAIVDDIGAIVVIALFYTNEISFGWLLAALSVITAIALLRSFRVPWMPLYVLLGIALWAATFKSGVHATIAGVVLGLMTPVRGRSTPVAERLQNALHPWSSYLIVPLFAFANAGIVLTAGTVEEAATSTVTIGIFLGLVVGKLAGITLFTRMALRLRIGTLSDDVSVQEITGVAAVAGIGFTVSLFITSLAFTDDAIVNEARIGILAASLLASAVGAFLLRRSVPR